MIGDEDLLKSEVYLRVDLKNKASKVIVLSLPNIKLLLDIKVSHLLFFQLNVINLYLNLILYEQRLNQLTLILF